MTKRCTHVVLGFGTEHCRNQAEWTFVDAEGRRGFACEHHLPEFERNYPDLMILPLDTENH